MARVSRNASPGVQTPTSAMESLGKTGKHRPVTLQIRKANAVDNIHLYDPFQPPDNPFLQYADEGMFERCCRGYEGIPLEEWEPIISVTFFPNQWAKSKQFCSTTLAELGDQIQKTNKRRKSALPWLKLATFGDEPSDADCLRYDDNVLSISGIELDYDAKRMTFDEGVAVAKRARLRALLYTSANYSDAAPKW